MSAPSHSKTVYFLVDTFPKLSETFILQQITGLIDLGYDVQIIARLRGGATEFQPEVKEYGLLSKVMYLDMPRNYLRLAGRLFAFYSRRPRFLAHYNFRSRYHLLALSLLPFLVKLDIGEEDAVICNFGNLGIQASLLKRLGKNFKLLTIFHGYDLSMFLKREPSNVYEDVFEYSDKLLPISQFWQKKLLELGAPQQNIEVFHMGIDTHKYNLPHLHGEKFTFMSVGRFVEKKGFEYSIQAFAKALPELGNNVEYIIVGDGPLFNKCEDMLKRLGLQKQVKLLGSKNSSEIKELLQKSDVFIVPSVTASNGDMEGIPIVMMEAQSMGVPVIATDHSGLSEGMQSGKTGLLVKEHNVVELAQAIKLLHKNHQKCEDFGQAGREFIEGSFNAQRQNYKLMELLKTL